MATAIQSINNMANAAAKAVWGTNGSTEEPVSGETGDVSKGEPYDAGNMEPQPTAKDTDNSASAPHKTQDSSVSGGDMSHAQQDVRSPSDPQTDQDQANKRSNVDNSAGGPDTDSNPAKVDGPGPKPVAELAKERGGDAGNVSSSSVDSEASKNSGDNAQKDQAAEDDDGPQKISHGEGTGEKYIKSTGLQADGGDFDATKAGAGREADRLLEEKGIHKGHDNMASDAHKSPESKDEKPPKKSLGEKIKMKLHRNHVEA